MSYLARRLGVLTFALRRRGPGRLHAFARAELASMLDLRLAAAATEDPTRAALYLAHAADEERHARMFQKRASRWAEELGGTAPPPVRADTDQLFTRLGEIGFLAFVHRGERRGRREFEAYRDHFRTEAREGDAALFEAVIEDERRHERYTGELLAALAPDAARALRRAALWEAWRAYRRAGRAVAAITYASCMLVVYVASAPLAAWVRLVRPTRAGWRAANAE